jgi:hypothetical protein
LLFDQLVVDQLLFDQLVVDQLRTLGGNLSNNFFGVCALAAGVGLGDVASNDQTGQVHFESLHSFGLAGADDITHLTSFAFTQEVAHCIIDHQSLVGRDSTTVFGRNEALANDSL